ncbi:hypothetical protein [Micromonospora aurantiaca (nom. illeg.)]|uniref:hypothetical protein n=1 Tax=Micromonospora aurantiaca (nom. illeg.) TaxID=47850 RepID=UPI00114CA50C|nr:hypothetical protein [Micromonospora aurantiaca]
MIADTPDPWYVLAWWDWIGVASAALGLIGLALALVQVYKARRAAQAALQAVRQTQGRIRASQIMVLAPQLRFIFRDIELSIGEENPSLTQRTIDRWRSQAAHISGLLMAEDNTGNTTTQKINAGIAQAVVANQALMKNSALDHRNLTKARTAMSEACDALEVWVGQNITKDAGQPTSKSSPASWLARRLRNETR